MDNLRLSTAPCRQACPLDISCQTYLRHLANGEPEKAASFLRRDTPFGAILGRVCHHPCETNCQREQVAHDGAVNIRAVKRYLSDAYASIVNGVLPKDRPTGHHIAIIGAGPSGMAAAYELAALGNEVDLYEAKEQAGGLLRYAIPQYRLPDGVVDDTIKLISDMGVKIYTGKKLGRDLDLSDLSAKYDAVILALGLPQSLLPKVNGIETPGVVKALDLLADLRSGKVPNVGSAVVIGGGNTALDTALSLKKGGVTKVTVVSLEGAGDMPVHETERSEAMEEGINFIHRCGVNTISHGQSGISISFARCLAVFDANGRFCPEMDASSPMDIETELVAFAIGQGAEEGFADLRKSDALGHTGQPKIWAAGDCAKGSSSIVQALAEGKRIGRIVHRELLGLFPLQEDRYGMLGITTVCDLPAPERAKGKARGTVPQIPVNKRNLSEEVENTLIAEQARTEAERCMACGRSFEANQTCWFCLPCEVECPTGALEVKIPYQVR